jgi:hypothetical protein
MEQFDKPRAVQLFNVHWYVVGFRENPIAQSEHWFEERQSMQLATAHVRFSEGAGEQPWFAIPAKRGAGQTSQETPLVLHCKQFWKPQTQAPLLTL